MTVRKISILIGGLAASALVVVSTSQADLSLRPGILTRMEYTDNLFLTDGNKNREVISTLAPSIELVQKSELTNTELNYSYVMYRYLNQPDLNDQKDSHRGQLDATILPNNDFHIQLVGEAVDETLDKRRSDAIDAATVNTTNRLTGKVRPALRLTPGEKSLIDIAYSYAVEKYDSPAAIDSKAERWELLLERKNSDRLKFNIGGNFEQFMPEDREEFEDIQALLGGEWRPYNSITMTVSGGNEWFRFDDETKNFDSKILDTSFKYETRKKKILNLRYRKFFEYDLTEGLYKSWIGEAGFSYSGRFSWVLSFLTSETEYLEVQRKDKESGIKASIDYRLTPKVTTGLIFSPRKLEFQPEGEEADRYSIEGYVNYSMNRNIELGCRYYYRQNESSFAFNNYEENRFSCDLGLAFSLVQ